MDENIYNVYIKIKDTSNLFLENKPSDIKPIWNDIKEIM